LSSLGAAYVFLGPELGEKLDAVQALRKKLAGVADVAGEAAGGSAPGGAAGSLEETSFYATETGAAEIAAIIKNGSLFSEKRFFIVKNAELFKKNDAELLASCLENPGDDTIVLLSDETRIDKKIEDAVPKANKRVFWEMFENKKHEWVAAFFGREGCRIEAGAVDAILEMVENNTDALRRECSRLIAFLGKDKPITAAVVEECLTHTREESAFTLFAAAARGSLDGSLDICRGLLAAKQSPTAIFAGLAWCFRKLGDYLALKAAGQTNDFELKKIGLGSPKIRSDYVEASRRFTDAGSALALIGEYDFLLRSYGKSFEELLMDSFICKLLGQAGR
jgi:DNA polymerase-3 subunit delta